MAEKIKTTKKKFVVHNYTVVKFEFEDDENERLFDCIPDIWFVNELKESCFFPPKTGKKYIQRAINCERPEDDWDIYPCKIVKGGFRKCQNKMTRLLTIFLYSKLFTTKYSDLQCRL